MNTPAPPVLTVRCEGTERSFAPGTDVVVGRDVRADLRVTNPLISRSHLLLRFDQGRWMAIDNRSLNGVFANGQRVPMIDIHDGQAINLGRADGPVMTFEIGRRGAAGRPPQTTMLKIPLRPGGPSPSGSQPVYPGGSSPSGQQPLHPGVAPSPSWPPQPVPPGHVPPAPPRPPYPPSGPQRLPTGPQQLSEPPTGTPPSGPQPTGTQPTGRPTGTQATGTQATGMQPTGMQPTGMQRTGMQPPLAEEAKSATRVISLLRLRGTEREAPPGSVTIGRATDNDIVIQDVLASRQHAALIQLPEGAEIRDLGSSNGTFVNGIRIESATLTEGDVVTIGNVDLVLTAGTLVRRTEAATLAGGLEVQSVSFSVEHGRQLLTDISLIARPGTLTALIGGSGAGKTTLSRVIAGYTRPSAGVVTFEGHNLHNEYAVLRSRIGMVPQDDVVHRQLTVNQALGYAAKLRLPPDTSKEDRVQVIAQVLEELELTNHANTRVDKLSGGQRKRASVALELLTGPSLLILDEPTSGLDPALDRQVMLMLRQLADAGRVVLVVTHSLTYLDVCDHVLLLAPGGKTAFYGAPAKIGEAMGTTNWADIFTKVGDDPDAANQRFLAQNRPPPVPTPAATQAVQLSSPKAKARTSWWLQFATIVRRQIRLIVSDRAYFAFLALLPFIMGTLALAVPGAPGSKGFGASALQSVAPTQPAQLLVLLNVGAVFMGTALTIRDLIGERPIFLREQAVGLSTSGYLSAKIVVFCSFAVVQATIMTTIVLLGKGTPTKGAAFLGHGTLAASIELAVGVAATCVTSALLGLLLSSLARSNEQIMPLLVVSIMSQLVLAGGMIAVTGRQLDILSWVTPARWGYSASASTVDLRDLISPNLNPQDSHWQHTPGAWLFDMGMLGALFLGFAIFVRWQIRLKR